MTQWIRTGRRFAAVLCALLAASGVAHAQPVNQTSGPNFGTFSIGQVETQLSANGGDGTNYAWSVTLGSLPPGVSIRTDKPSFFPPGASAGLIGVATTPGNYSFTLRATSNGFFQDQPCTLKVTALVSKDGQLPDAFVGTPLSYQLTALGNTGAVTWASPSNMPAGLSLSATGMLSGTPTTAGNANPGFSLTDTTPDTVFKGVNFTIYAVQITNPGLLPNLTQNTPYSATIAATGGAGGYTFSANNLPNGLSINSSSGLISGTVSSGGGSNVGRSSVNVTAKDSLNVSYTKTMSIDVLGSAPVLPSVSVSSFSGALDDCTIGVACSRTVSVMNGGRAPFTWTAVSGLPPGMTIRTGSGTTASFVTPGDVQLWGAPTALGTSNVFLRVTDADGVTAANTFPLKVVPLMQTAFLSSGTIGVAYSQTLRVIGGAGPYSAAVTAGQLPAGLSLNPSTFLVSGTPTENGNFSWVTTFTDAGSVTLRLTSSLNISGGASTANINTNANLGFTTTGSSYSNTLNACCAGAFNWTLTSGTLPNGLTLSAGGVLSGTSTTNGTFTFLVKATDTGNATNTASRQFTLTVTPLAITSSSTLPFGNVGTAYAQTLVATGGTGTVTWTVAAGSYLPPGLTLAANGALNGTPTETGQYRFTVTATDTASHDRSSAFIVSIYPVGGGPPTAQTQNANFGTFSIGQLETALSATGGDGTYVWSVIAGSLPPGLAVRTDKPSFFPPGASAGLIGVATTPGTYSFTLRVTSAATTADQASTLKVTALALKDTQLPDAFVGTPMTYTLTALGNAGSVTFTPTGSLPGGLSLSAAGVLSGTPSTPGFANVSFSLTDGVDTVFKGVNFSINAVQITTAGVLPNATQNSPYPLTTITATGGAGGYTFTANGLPNGLTISSGGVISGTVSSGNSSVGKVTVNVTATDSSSVSYTKAMSIDILGAAAALPSLSTMSYTFSGVLDDCTIGANCSRGVGVQNGGTAPFTWTASGLPPGVSIRTGSGTTTSFVTPGDVQLWGTPTALGSYAVLLRVTDAGGATATNTFPLKVVPLLQTTFLSNGTIGVAYSATLRVLGGTSPYGAAVTAGLLPAGLTLNPSTFVVSGTPTENGNLSWVTTFTDAGSVTLRVTTNLFVSGGASNSNINTNANLGSTTTGSSYSNPLSACCAGAFNWTLTSGTIPPGLTLSLGGLLSGTSTLSGTYTFVVKATDTGNATNTASRQFTLTVTPLAITSSSTLPFGTVGTAYAQTLTATGGTGTVTWTVAAGSYLPPALTLGSNGALGGTPTESGQYRFTVTAADTASHTRSTTVTVSIYPVGGPPRFTDQPLIAGSTAIRAVHTNELRTAIDALRVRFSLAPFIWTDPTLTGGVTFVRAQHILDMRTALAEAYTAASLTPPTYTDPGLLPLAPIKAVHIEELRAAVVAIE